MSLAEMSFAEGEAHFDDEMSLAESDADIDVDKSLVVVNIEDQLIHLQTERDALINEKQALKE